MRLRLALAILTLSAFTAGAAHAASVTGSTSGIGGAIHAYYDANLLTINLKQLTTAEATLLAKNGQQNTIWMSDAGLPGGQPFVAVIDAIPGDGMNPMWAEVQIAFTAGNTPRQLFSDDDVAKAFAAGEITLTPTHEMYRCAVIGATIAGLKSVSAPAGPSSSTWSRIRAAYR